MPYYMGSSRIQRQNTSGRPRVLEKCNSRAPTVAVLLCDSQRSFKFSTGRSGSFSFSESANESWTVDRWGGGWRCRTLYRPNYQPSCCRNHKIVSPPDNNCKISQNMYLRDIIRLLNWAHINYPINTDAREWLYYTHTKADENVL